MSKVPRSLQPTRRTSQQDGHRTVNTSTFGHERKETLDLALKLFREGLGAKPQIYQQGLRVRDRVTAFREIGA